MKRSLITLALAALACVSACAQTNTVYTTTNDALTRTISANGTKKIVISATGTLEFVSGGTITGASHLRTALGLGDLATLSAVGSMQITNDSIVNADINASAGIVLSKLAITGTPDGTKYLRDDGSWQSISTGITVNTTAVSGGAVGNVLFHKTGNVVGELGVSTGGNGEDDAGKLMQFDENGGLEVTNRLLIKDAVEGDLYWYLGALTLAKGGFVNSLVFEAPTNDRTTIIPDADGWVALVANRGNNSASITINGSDRTGVVGLSIFGHGLRSNGVLESNGFIVYTSDNGVQRHFYLERDGATTDNALQLGLDSGTPPAQTIKAADGSGTNIAGANLIVAGGRGTGDASGGSVLFQTSTPGSSGTTESTLATRMSVAAGGATVVGKVTINKAGQSEAGGIETIDDPANGTVRALRVLAPDNSNRIYFGKSGQTVYALNFEHVTGFESVPAFDTASGFRVGGATNTYITRANGGTEIGANHPDNGGFRVYQKDAWDSTTAADLALQVKKTEGTTIVGASSSLTNFEGLNLAWDGSRFVVRPVAGSGGGSVRRIRFYLSGTVWIGSGSGSPESVEAADVGSIYTDEATGDVYRKTSGTGNTGWVTP